jgi:hypothetical protein
MRNPAKGTEFKALAKTVGEMGNEAAGVTITIPGRTKVSAEYSKQMAFKREVFGS